VSALVAWCDCTPREDFHRRPEYAPPEIMRRELSQMLLDLRMMKIETLPLVGCPSRASHGSRGGVTAAAGGPGRQGARLTPTGAAMARYPLHPAPGPPGNGSVPAAALLGRGCALAALLKAPGLACRQMPRAPEPSDLFAAARRRVGCAGPSAFFSS